MQRPLLSMEGISKQFAGVPALQNIDFTVREGEVHGLMGENGAGKSTLIKILTGIYTRDTGKITFDGKPLETGNIIDVQKAGISTIYQELNLIPHLSVAENMFLGREIKRKGRIDWKETHQRAKEILEGFDIDIDVTLPVKELSAAYQQIASIARAISVDAKLVIMDEPTSSLDDKEVKILMKVIRKLQEKKIAVIFISHRLQEVFDICQQVTILKDGELVGMYPIEELDEHNLVSLMIGQKFERIECRAGDWRIDSPEFLRSEKVASGMKVRDIGFRILEGECVGMVGLLGSGRTEFADVLFGAAPLQGGKLYVAGEEKKIKNPRDAIKEKFAYLSEDRKRNGIVPNMSVRENLTLCIMPQISRFGVVSKNKEKQIVAQYIDRLNIKTSSMEKKIKQLSGGNQQKVLLARWLATNPKLIILDEPTRGIDVGAKAEIEKLIQELVDSGISVLMISSEWSELIRNCSRVQVLRDGIVVGELKGKEVCEVNIIGMIASDSREGETRNASSSDIA